MTTEFDHIPYPSWVCHDCGMTHGMATEGKHYATYHQGQCGVCGKKAIVTEPRDYGHLKLTWVKDAVESLSRNSD